MFEQRSAELELMDHPQPEEALFQNLRELAFINKWLGGHAVTLNALDRIFTPALLAAQPKRIWRIADLGSGGGDMLRAISDWAARRRIAVQLVGIDLNPVMIKYATAQSRAYASISYRQLDILSDEFSRLPFDVVTCSLFCHHFTNEQLVHLFGRLRSQCRLAVVVNDIHRNPLAFYAIKGLTALFSRSYLVRHDAPLSVLRAFRKQELLQLFRQAGFARISLRWKWAFRWQAVLSTSPSAASSQQANGSSR